jgi:flavin reductase (DIM6/NTAB) family NADH-FMN oxidoreductase RutF
MSSPIEPWAAALGRLPSGLLVLTAAGPDGSETGLLASWVQQCGFDPPQLTAAVRAGRYVLDWLTPGAAFAVNVIPDGERGLVKHFGKGFEPGEPAFAGLTVDRPSGVAVLTADALAWLDCRVANQVPVGDHVLVVGRIVGGDVLKAGRPAVHVRNSGLHY